MCSEEHIDPLVFSTPMNGDTQPINELGVTKTATQLKPFGHACQSLLNVLQSIPTS